MKWLLAPVVLLLLACALSGMGFSYPGNQALARDNSGDERAAAASIQFTTLSDLDGDRALDRAVIVGAGPVKSIKVSLSHSHTSTELWFFSSSAGTGSILARDVDQDGDVDLVWADLVHPQEVIVWLNDGLGRFERARPGQFDGSVILDGGGIAGTDPAGKEHSAGSSQRPPLDVDSALHQWWCSDRTPSYRGRPEAGAPMAAAALDSERGPPTIST